MFCGVSRNSSQLTISIDAITTTDRLAHTATEATNDTWQNVSWTGEVSAGDVIRIHTDGGASKADADISVSMTATSTNVITPTTSTAPTLRSSAVSSTISNATLTYLDFDTSGFDDDSLFTGCGSGHVTTTETGCRIVAPRKGRIHNCAKAQLASNANWAADDQAFVRLYKNGSVAPGGELSLKEVQAAPTSLIMDFNGCTTVDVEKGDYLEVGLFQSNTGTVAIGLSGNDFQNHWSAFYVDQGANWAGAEIVTTPGMGGKAVLVQADITDGASTTTVSGDDSDFINGNCTNDDGGDYVCTFTTDFWAESPRCWTVIRDDNRTIFEDSTSTASIDLDSRNLSNTQTDSAAFTLFCHGKAN